MKVGVDQALGRPLRQNLNKKKWLPTDRRLTLRILSSELEISQNTVHMIFKDDLHMFKVVQGGAEAAVRRSTIGLNVNIDVVR